MPAPAENQTAASAAERILICHRCPRAQRPVDGVMLCSAAQRDVVKLAETNACPEGRHGSVSRPDPSSGSSGTQRPIKLLPPCGRPLIRPDQSYVINLDRRGDRLKEFRLMYAGAGFPANWPTPERFAAVDASKLAVPSEYTQQAGGFGCMRSHVNLLERVLQKPTFSHCSSVLVFEDDAIATGIGAELQGFLSAVPDDWDLLLLGCQHFTTPTVINDQVVKVTNAQRTHCYLARGRMLQALYHQWALCTEHIDWRWNRILQSYNVYAPARPLVAQRQSFSDIEQRNVPQRDWGMATLTPGQGRSPLTGDQLGPPTHSGKLGDMVYAMAVLRLLAQSGGTTLYIHDKPDPSGYRLSRADFDAIAPLLRAQSYVRDVVWCPGGLPEGIVESPLNGFRRHVRPGRNLADAHLHAYGLPRQQGKWLDAKLPLSKAQVVFSRSFRYRNPDFDWRRIVQKYGDKAVFLGTREEHQNFRSVYGDVPWVETKDLLEAARVIASAKLFVGNQSCLAAIAEGVGVPQMILEVSRTHDNCRFERPGRINCDRADCVLPDLHATDVSKLNIPLAGDVVAKIANKIGADRLAGLWEKWTGKPCGCKQRQEKLNAATQKLLAYFNGNETGQDDAAF